MPAEEPGAQGLIVRRAVHLVRRGVGSEVNLVPHAPLLAQGRAGGLVRTRAYWYTLVAQLTGAAALTGIAVATGSAGPLGGILGLSAAAIGTLRAFHDRWLRLRVEKLRLTEDLAATRRGSVVRVRGLVLDGPTFSTSSGLGRAVLGRFLGRTSLLASNGVSFGRTSSVEELHGLDFRLRTAQGQELMVKVSHAFLVSRDEDFSNHQHIGRPLASQASETSRGFRVTELLREELIGVGDVVEVVGVFREEVDPQGARPDLRSPPMLFTLTAGDFLPVLIREVDVEAPACTL